MDVEFDEGSSAMEIAVRAGIASAIAGISFLGGLFVGKGAATKASNEKLYKLAKGGKVDDIFSEEELKQLEKSINNNRVKKVKASNSNN